MFQMLLLYINCRFIATGKHQKRQAARAAGRTVLCTAGAEIRLCDSLAADDGIVIPEKRFVDVTGRNRIMEGSY